MEPARKVRFDELRQAGPEIEMSGKAISLTGVVAGLITKRSGTGLKLLIGDLEGAGSQISTRVLASLEWEVPENEVRRYHDAANRDVTVQVTGTYRTMPNQNVIGFIEATSVSQLTSERSYAPNF